jgi:hypothetical protein
MSCSELSESSSYGNGNAGNAGIHQNRGVLVTWVEEVQRRDTPPAPTVNQENTVNIGAISLPKPQMGLGRKKTRGPPHLKPVVSRLHAELLNTTQSCLSVLKKKVRASLC